MTRIRNWFGTVWDAEELEQLTQLRTNYTLISAPDSTTENQIHWHVLLCFQNQRRRVRSGAQTSHWEPVHDIQGTINYILEKGQPFFEHGRRPVPRPQDINERFRAFLEYAKTHTPKQLLDSDYAQFYARYPRVANQMHDYYNRPPIIDGDLTNLWFWGEAGTGKTRKAWELEPELYTKGLNKWWDTYEDQKTVLIDEWSPVYKIMTSHFKQWGDRYPFVAEIKGESRLIRPKRIIVTSNYTIQECFEPTDVEPILRRFKQIHFITQGSRPDSEGYSYSYHQNQLYYNQVPVEQDIFKNTQE